MSEIYLITHIICAFILLGFYLAKAESPFLDADFKYWIVSISIIIFVPIFVLLIIVGVTIHQMEQ